MLTALSSVQDKVSALDFGADDYMTKPFHFDELLSRINALTRRNQYAQNVDKAEVFSFGDVIVDVKQYNVKVAGEEVELSPREFKLFNYPLGVIKLFDF